jgi:soluble lytic murein transglycosylase
VLARAEAAEADNDHSAAVTLYEQLLAGQPFDPQVVIHRLGRASLAAGNRGAAAAAFMRIRYEFPLSDEAELADAELEHLAGVGPRPSSEATARQELARAERLFASRRYTQARQAFQSLRSIVAAEDRDLVELRAAESDFYAGRYAAARDGLRPFLDSGPRQAEAQFFYLAALGELGQHDEYLSRVRALVDAHPQSSWSEEALNNLGTHYILVNEDAAAAEAFRELLSRFPKGPRGERAAWKVGWWEYKNGNWAETVRIFETAAATYPRSDYRPSWVYWAARARERIGDRKQAAERYRLVTADYLNSYYGRLATRRLDQLDRVARASLPVPPQSQEARASEVTLPPTADRIRLLLSLGLELDALNELRFAQRQWGSSPAVEATIAWVYYRQGDLRRAINQMKRAYPQHLTASGGARLPDELLRVIFPLDYWASIQKYSRARGLDPFIVAALVAQESTFDPKIRSAANAYGLMQVVPGTGRRLARSLGIRYRGVQTLTNAETNLRMGTLYFSRLIEQFGSVHLALAAYNAGENRIVRWVAERPGLERDEFIDDIPFPETQTYVKKILGTAEDYRVLYGSRHAKPGIDRGGSDGKAKKKP